jgi:hypothetical protein
MRPNITSFLQITVPAFLLFCVAAAPALAATGCDLNDADRDVPRLLPGSTSYKTIYVSIGQQGDASFLRKIEDRLGERYLALYAPIDQPYTIYEIYNGKKKIGYIHGVNQKGQFGGMQIFIAQDLNGTVKTFYLQRIPGQKAGKFRDPKFCRQFVGLALKDFDTFDPASGKGSGRIAQISNPVPERERDFHGVLRGLKKNLVLMDAFVFSEERKIH